MLLSGMLNYTRPDEAKRKLLIGRVFIEPAERGEGIEPGVERSGTPGTQQPKNCGAREAAESGRDYKTVNRDDSTVGRFADSE